MPTIAALPSLCQRHHGLLAIAVGWLALFGPIYYQLDQTTWNEPQHSHAPFILLVVLFLAWRQRHALKESAEPSTRAGIACLLLGALLVLLGSRIDSPFLLMLAQMPLAAGLLLLLLGKPSLKSLWFALLYLLFMVPVPGVIIDASTGVLKEWVSHAVESGLYHLGYPIARRGVVLTIGRYDLLVADACSGLNSIVALTALVSLMVYLRRHPSRTYNALMIASILPIALFANFARVLCLTLVTYYGGISAFERAHDMAGLLVFAISILSFYALDAVLTRCLADKKQLEEHNAQPQH